MIKKIALNTFKNTGDINSFLEYKQIEDLENNMKISENETDKENEKENRTEL